MDVTPKGEALRSPSIETAVREWVSRNWDPAMPLGEWWQRLADSGWAQPSWPEEWGGRGVDTVTTKEIKRVIADTGAMAAPFGVGTMIVAPALLEVGDRSLLARYLPDIANGRAVWCQLFSEPNAGSDLAGVQARAVRDGDEWIVNGQKVWTSAGHYADHAILLARTDTSVPKHRGLTFFAMDMDQPGVDIRPLRQMNGLAEFNEVFLTDARVPDANIIGGEGGGWGVAMVVMAHERASLDADRETTGGLPIRLDLTAPAGSYVESIDTRSETDPSGLPVGDRARTLLLSAVRESGAATDPVVRQQVARVVTLINIARYSAGTLHPSLMKNLTTQMLRLFRECSLAVQGPHGTLADDDARFDGVFQQAALTMQGVFIASGTEEIQRNIIGERLLGLPPEPRVDKDLPFDQVRQQAAPQRS